MEKYLKNLEILEKKFWENVEVGKEKDDCWDWKANFNNEGKPTITCLSTGFLAHKISYILTNPGETPKFIKSKCKNFKCTNPSHLYGTEVSREPMSREETYKSLVKRFWEKVIIPENPDECWGWSGTVDSVGYAVLGTSKIYKMSTKAHRLSCQIHGIDLGELFCCHACSNSICTNPKHLYAGTPAENSRDMVNAGRSAKGDKNGSRLRPERLKRGIEHPLAVFSFRDLERIVELKSDGLKSSHIAKKFKVSTGQITDFLTGVRYIEEGKMLNVSALRDINKEGLNPKAKLGRREVLYVRKLIQANISTRAIAEMLKVRSYVINDIRKGKRYKEVTEES